MNCHQTRQLVSAYLDQELTGRQMLEISAHLQLCHTCAQEWREVNDVRRLLRGLPPPRLPGSAEIKLAARLECEGTYSLPGLVLRWMRDLYGDFSQWDRRQPARRTAYAFALASMAVLAVAVPFAPSTGDAAGTILLRHGSRQPAPVLQAQNVMPLGLTPSLRLTGAASAIEADPLNDDTISGYVQGDATMANFQTSDYGAR